MSMNANPFHLEQPDFSLLYIVGAGGHGRELAWLARQCWGDRVNIVHLVDHPDYLVNEANGHPVRLLASASTGDHVRYVVGIGDIAARRRLAGECARRGLRATSLVHPRVEASASVRIAEGAVIAAGSVVTTNVRIGLHAVINIGCTISHDVMIGDFATLSPGVHVSGHVSIGPGVFIGAGACIINGRGGSPLVIGEGATVAAGACVTFDVEPSAMVAGVPATRRH